MASSSINSVVIEVLKTEDSTRQNNSKTLRRRLVRFLDQQDFKEDTVFQGDQINQDLTKDVARIRVEWTSDPRLPRDIAAADKRIFIYQFLGKGPAVSGEMKDMEAKDKAKGKGKDKDKKELPSATLTELPNSELEGLWESLIFSTSVKKDLMAAITVSLTLARKQVDPKQVGLNRVALLHGPPGTGKTSLCQSLANKLAIRLTGEGGNFTKGLLVEISSHSLSSMWQGESGRLVERMFDVVKKRLADPSTFVVVLIDEVESLTSARKSAGNGRGQESSDSLAAVNALLTQIDTIKRFPNVLVLATSNLTGSIDMAFVDRADIKQYVGLPPPEAIAQMLDSSLQELVRAGLVSPPDLHTPAQLMEVAELCHTSGFSGRTVRKLPYLALTQHPDRQTWGAAEFLASLLDRVVRQGEDRQELLYSHNTA